MKLKCFHAWTGSVCWSCGNFGKCLACGGHQLCAWELIEVINWPPSAVFWEKPDTWGASIRANSVQDIMQKHCSMRTRACWTWCGRRNGNEPFCFIPNHSSPHKGTSGLDLAESFEPLQPGEISLKVFSERIDPWVLGPWHRSTFISFHFITVHLCVVKLQ